jgi:hypothetical protein
MTEQQLKILDSATITLGDQIAVLSSLADNIALWDHATAETLRKTIKPVGEAYWKLFRLQLRLEREIRESQAGEVPVT